MKLIWEKVNLELETPFRIAHGTSYQRESVILHMEEGLGEGAVVPYYGETSAGIINYIEGLNGENWEPLQLATIVHNLPPGSKAAKACVDIALHDLWAKRIGKPLFNLIGIDPLDAPLTSLTIPIDDPGKMAARARDLNWPILKIKLGSQDDEKAVAMIREVTSVPLRVDANAGWDRQQAQRRIQMLSHYGVEMVEQPLSVGDLEGLHWLRSQHLGVPIFVDENIQSDQDVAKHAGAVDGVVIKLMKCGGIQEAIKCIHVARALDMKVMLSCMVESSLGVTAAAHIAPLCDYVDLDAPLLIKNDPFLGVRYDGARLIMPDGPGLGVIRRNLSGGA